MKDPELLARIDERVKGIGNKIDGLNDHIKNLYGKDETVNTRIDGLATKQSWIIGASSSVGVVLSAAIASIFAFVAGVFR